MLDPSRMKASECEQKYGYSFVGNPDAEVHPSVIHIMETNKVMEQRSEEWYQQRFKVVSASDIASAIGDNPHKPAHSLLKDKVYGATFKGNEHTAHGQKYEPVATELFCERTGHTVFEFGLLPHPKYKFLAGSPDGICADGSIIEIKCPLTREIKDEIPSYYYPQVQTVMEITSSPTGLAYFIQYKPKELAGKEIFSVTEVPRSKEWFEASLPKIVTFWKDVMFYREHPYMLEPCQIVTDLY